MALSKTRQNVYKYMTTVGCFLLFLPYGQTFYWGNMYVYCKSYLAHYTGMAPSAQAPWLLTLKIATTSVTSLLSGILVRYTGKRPLLVTGITLTFASHFLTYFAIQKSNLFVILSFGVLYGLSDGFLFCIGNQMIVDWAGDKDGTFIAICSSGMYVGATVTNAFITLYVNPENKVPDMRAGPVLYFTQEDVLEKVPSLFICLAIFCAVAQVIGFILVRNKTLTEKGIDGDGVEMTDDFEKYYGSCENTKISSNGDGGNKQTENGPENHSTRRPSSTSSQLPPPLPSPPPSSLTSENKKVDTPEDLSPLQMIATTRFYVLFITFITTTISYVAINNYYKEFGQLWIADDFFLTQIGTAIPFAAVFFSLLWGALMDKFSIKTFFIIFNLCLTILGCFYSYIPRLGSGMFSVYTVVYGGMVSPLYSIYNGAAVKLFGKTYLASNQGVIFLPSIVFDLVSNPMFRAILLHLGWDYLFLFSALTSLIGMLAVVTNKFRR